MAVKRIVANILAPDPQTGRRFYGEILGLEIVMDQGWILTFAGEALQRSQLSLASEGGGGTALPALSIEVDDLKVVLDRLAAAGIRPEYGPADEPWGVRRVFVRDPFGQLINILQHGTVMED
ncbi:VOC family protein [Mangrovibrevibacter kandeliae]|uniref:VOC family protein n=1 Tax=Mangrovibrevibacter kandeliae TaxID=2968473 RepID=UPI00211806DD|nr:VOC family protein [Aurantimonas sp. CSK15Z-1]MCQ8784049.1 VOC family protein [Aurantimonas sp. CSK15Z-1]